MVYRQTIEMTLSESYRLFSAILVGLIIFAILLFFFVKSRLNIKFLKEISKFSEEHQKTIVVVSFIFLLICILSFGIIKFMLYNLDKSTTVHVDEKIVIIELDDWWNFNDTTHFFDQYGYNFERFKSVTDIINKHNFTATMGVTPYIFIEDLRQNFPLRNDQKMIDYINEMKGRGYEIGMHGYNHCRNDYYCPQYEEVWYNVDSGKRELEDIFETSIITYFPPGNTWTTEQYENVKKAGFKIVGNTHVPKAYFDEDVIITQKGYDPIYIYYWYLLDFRHCPVRDWKIAYDLTYNKDKNQLLNGIIESFEGMTEDDRYSDEKEIHCNYLNYMTYRADNLFILQLHQNTFDTLEKLDDLDEFLDYIENDGAKVMTYKEFYDYILEKRKQEGKSLAGRVVLEVDNEK